MHPDILLRPGAEGAFRVPVPRRCGTQSAQKAEGTAAEQERIPRPPLLRHGVHLEQQPDGFMPPGQGKDLPQMALYLPAVPLRPVAFEYGEEEFPGSPVAPLVEIIALLPRHPQEESLPLVHDMLLAAYPHRAASGQGILEEIGFPSSAVLQVIPGGMPGLPADGHQLYERLLHVLQEIP